MTMYIFYDNELRYEPIPNKYSYLVKIKFILIVAWEFKLYIRLDFHMKNVMEINSKPKEILQIDVRPGTGGK